MKKKQVFATHITTPGGKRIYIRGKTKEELEEKVMKAKLEMGAGVDIGDATTFEEFARTWVQVYKAPPKLRPNSYATLMGNLEKHIIPYFGKYRLRDIKPIHVQAFLSSIADKSRSVQSKCIQCVRAILRSAEDNGLISRSPVRSSDKPSGPPAKEEEPLTSEHAQQLLDAVRGTRAYLFCLLALSTGMRRGEILGLMWEDVDLVQRCIRVRHNKAFVNGKSDADVTTLLKSDASRRELPIPNTLFAELVATRKQTNSVYVLSMRNGKSLTRASFTSMWGIVTARTAGPDREVGDRVRGSNSGPLLVSLGFSCHPHQLRHTYITQLFESGLDLKQVQYLAGHSTPSMTLRVYTHYRQKSRAAETAEKVRAATAYLGVTGTENTTPFRAVLPSHEVSC